MLQFFSWVISLTAISTTIKNDKEARVVRKLQERILKSFMDVIVMALLKDGWATGYDIIKKIQGRYEIIMSSGTIYSMLYNMERHGLLSGSWEYEDNKAGKRVYKLTDEGKKTLEVLTVSYDKIKGFMAEILKPQPFFVWVIL